MEKINNFELFDAKVEKYLRNKMTDKEENLFMEELASDSELKERARITALMIKTMQQEGMKQDVAIVEKKSVCVDWNRSLLKVCAQNRTRTCTPLSTRT